MLSTSEIRFSFCPGEATEVGQQPRERRTIKDYGPAQIDVEVGLNLRRARLARGYSQTTLGDGLGIAFQQVQKYERGTNRLSASMLGKAARFLDITPTDLLPPDETATPAPDFAPQAAWVRGVAEIANAYRALRSPALRRALLHLARVMAREEALATAGTDGETGSLPR